jgi:hypothetical protein
MRILVLYILVAATGTVVVVVCLHLLWRAVGAYRISRAGPRPLSSARHLIWRDPGPVHQLDFRSGPGGVDGAPGPPFRFFEEHQLDDPGVRKMFEEHSWAWDDNPFVGSPQLNGLKVVVMDVAHNISPSDVRWLHRYLGQITDAQLREGLLASGATVEEADRFTRALRERIRQLGRV